MQPFISIFFYLALPGSTLTFFLGAIPWDAVWKGALERLHGNSTRWNPLLDERMPHFDQSSFLHQHSLAVSGAIMQALFQNPLASPSVLGISCGGCLLVIPVSILGLHYNYPFFVPLAAFSGCLLTLVLVYRISKQNGLVHLHHLILTGIAV